MTRAGEGVSPGDQCIALSSGSQPAIAPQKCGGAWRLLGARDSEGLAVTYAILAILWAVI